MRRSKATDAAGKSGLITKSVGVNLAALAAAGSSRVAAVPTAIMDSFSEYEWQRHVVLFAESHGWRTAHCRKTLVKMGKDLHYETTMPKGWFDLVMARDSNRGHRDSLYFVELKVEPNVQSDEQKAWEKLMTACGQTCYLWYPRHWEVVQKILSRPVEE